MLLERVERYNIELGAQGTVLKMRQGRRGIGVACLSLAVLLVSWWFGPHGPGAAGEWPADSFYWIWTGFFSLVFILGLVGASSQEDWTITEQDIVVTKRLGPWRSTRRLPRARALGIRVEFITGGEDRPMFPYRLHFLDPERKDSGLRIDLQQTRSVDRLLDALRLSLALDVEDPTRGRPSSRTGIQ